MTEYIIMMLVVAVFMAILAYIFITGAVRAKKENRNIRFAFAVLGSLIMVPSRCRCDNFFLDCFYYRSNELRHF